jgi:cell division protein FtsX
MRTGHVLAIGLIALMLILPAASYLFAKLCLQIGDNLSRARTISVFTENQSEGRLDQLTTRLRQYEQIERATLVPAAIDSASGINTRLLEVVPVAALAPVQFANIAEQLRTLPGVSMVSWSEETLQRNLQAAHYARLAALASLALAAILFTVLTWFLIRNSIRSSRAVVDIKFLLGATPHQISHPVVARGVLLGLLIAVAGYAIVATISLVLANIVDITILKIRIQSGIFPILLYAGTVLVLSFIVAQLAFRRTYSYLYQQVS